MAAILKMTAKHTKASEFTSTSMGNYIAIMIEIWNVVDIYLNTCRIRIHCCTTLKPMGTYEMAAISKMAAKPLGT